jgi:Rrf2 family protein
MLSSKARYGLRAMAVLGAQELKKGTGGAVELMPVEQIAEQHDIPLKFLEATLTQLRKRGLLRSRRGPAGGYTLARPAKDISLAEIIRTLDGPFAPTPCARTRDPHQCEGCINMDECGIRPFMREVRDAMAEVLEKKTLVDLVEAEQRGERLDDVPMYYI